MNWGAIGALVGVAGIAFGVGAWVNSSNNQTEQLSSRVDDLEKKPPLTIPVGTVLAFDLEECPSEQGWEEYKEAYGRFIRGIDKSNKQIDPKGKRLPGDLQGDSFKLHNHSVENTAGGQWDGGNDGDGSHLGVLTKRNTSETGDSETRPKNVALLYCKKI